jgi:hypothetical protein
MSLLNPTPEQMSPFTFGVAAFMTAVAELNLIRRTWIGPGLHLIGPVAYNLPAILLLPLFIGYGLRRRTLKWVASGDLSPEMAAKVGSGLSQLVLQSTICIFLLVSALDGTR